MRRIERALISVSDKTGIVEFVRELSNLGIEILSTGGTMKTLEENGMVVRSVSSYTKFPEMLDGRLKTLHPKIHGGLLAQRDNPRHMAEVENNDIELIDLVVVNLYPFKTVIQNGGSLKEAIENIDIGGPTMLRSAAKNFKDVAVVTSQEWYPKIIRELKESRGVLSEKTRTQLAVEVFALTADYDAAIHNYLKNNLASTVTTTEGLNLGQELILNFRKIQDLRYGENPHQQAAFYRDMQTLKEGLSAMKQLQGKELSFNNIMDIDTAFAIAAEFEEPVAVIVKHNNPCGAAVAPVLKEAYKQAFECDSLSAFGGIIGLNRTLDGDTTKAILDSGFVECIIAPGFEEESLELLKEKKNLRLIACDLPSFGKPTPEMDFKKVLGGLLVQERDIKIFEDIKAVTKIKPSDEQLASLLFGWKIVKFVKSNAIVLCQGTRTVGIGAGQMSRVDSVIIAAHKAGKKAKGACLASDAFFPKPDGIEEAAKAGVAAIIQPGGSISDEEIIKAADKHTIAMLFTGMRHFRH